MANGLPVVTISLPKKASFEIKTGGSSIFGKTSSVGGKASEFVLAGSPGATAKGSTSALEWYESAKVETGEMKDAEFVRSQAAPDRITLLNMPFVLPEALPGASALAAEAAAVPAGTKASWGIAAVGAAEAAADAGKGVVVAVLDSGIRQTHAAFEGVTIIPRNYTGPDETDVTDRSENGHGTHTAATIVGRDVDGVRIGIARGVETLLVGKILEDGVVCTTAMISQALFWALGLKADIINMSLGLDFPGFVASLMKEKRSPEEATSIALMGYRYNLRTFDSLSDTLDSGAPGLFGGIVVAASGNESRRPDYAIIASPPASGKSFFSVGAVDSKLAIWPRSNQDVDICAPGVEILSASHADDRKLVALTGTSMAAPHVAGVAALYCAGMKNQPGYTPQDLRQRLVDQAQKLPGSARLDVGEGLVKWTP